MTKFTFIERAALLSSLCFLFTGCTSLTGLDAGSTFSCNVPDGIPCQNVESAYRGSLESSQGARRFPLVNRTSDRAPEMRSTRVERAERDTNVREESYQRLTSDTPVQTQSQGAWEGAREVFYTPDGDSLLTLPRRVPERVLTLFVAPWTDRDGDLHEGEVLYVTVSRSHWAEGGRRAYYAQKRSIRHVGELTRTPMTRLKREVPEEVREEERSPARAHPVRGLAPQKAPEQVPTKPLWVEENVLRDGEGHPVLNREQTPIRQMSPVEAVSAAQNARAAIQNAFALQSPSEESSR